MKHQCDGNPECPICGEFSEYGRGAGLGVWAFWLVYAAALAFIAYKVFM